MNAARAVAVRLNKRRLWPSATYATCVAAAALGSVALTQTTDARTESVDLAVRRAWPQWPADKRLPVCADVGQLYNLDSVIGRGGFGLVHEGRDRQSQTPVAIKRVCKQNTSKDKFLQEVEILRAMGGHHNVVGLCEAFETTDAYVLVTELVEGEELFEHLVNKGVFSEQRARRLAHQIAQTLAYLHEHRVVHGDLKPENILLSSDASHMRLIDFGQSFREHVSAERSRCLGSGVATVAYAAPEVIKSANRSTSATAGSAIDMWGLGGDFHSSNHNQASSSMATFTFTPHIGGRLPTPSLSVSSSYSSTSKRKPKFNSITTTRVSLQASTPSLSDPFVLQLAETLEDSLSSSSSSSSPFPLQKLRESSAENLLSTPWPSRRDEPFRFTDVSFIKQSQIHPISNPPQFSELSSIPLETQFANVVIVDGHFVNSVSNLTELPNGVYVGSFIDLPSESVGKRVSEFVDGKFAGDLFWSINGVGAPDLTVVYVPAGCKVENPIHFRYYSINGGDEGSKELAVSNPRVLVLVENGGEIEIIEEFLSGDGGKSYWSNPVLEVVIGSGGKVKHSYIQNQSLNAAHIKWTSVQQESTSAYELVEISTGGRLSRHNVHIQQLGPETTTELSTLHLSIGNQTQDLHSSLVLDHPRGYSRQLHKCIVANPQGQAVFDGNVKVNRYAQQTDAGQLTRSLLLEPRATVNVKPNLQIIADDVKCSHGAAISDLEETQLFYFQARGIDLETARKALIFSFGAEVIERLPSPSVRKRVENHIKELLNPTLERS